jgi:hypothetical protein
LELHALLPSDEGIESVVARDLGLDMEPERKIATLEGEADRVVLDPDIMPGNLRGFKVLALARWLDLTDRDDLRELGLTGDLDPLTDLEILHRDFRSPERLDELVRERSSLGQHLALAVALEASGAMHGAERVLTGSATAGAGDELEIVDDEGFVIHGMRIGEKGRSMERSTGFYFEA